MKLPTRRGANCVRLVTWISIADWISRLGNTSFERVKLYLGHAKRVRPQASLLRYARTEVANRQWDYLALETPRGRGEAKERRQAKSYGNLQNGTATRNGKQDSETKHERNRSGHRKDINLGKIVWLIYLLPFVIISACRRHITYHYSTCITSDHVALYGASHHIYHHIVNDMTWHQITLRFTSIHCPTLQYFTTLQSITSYPIYSVHVSPFHFAYCILFHFVCLSYWEIPRLFS